MIVGNSKLNSHQQRFEPPDDKKDERIGNVHQADLFMIDSRYPLVDNFQPRTLERQRLIDSFHYGS